MTRSTQNSICARQCRVFIMSMPFLFLRGIYASSLRPRFFSSTPAYRDSNHKTHHQPRLTACLRLCTSTFCSLLIGAAPLHNIESEVPAHVPILLLLHKAKSKLERIISVTTRKKFGLNDQQASHHGRSFQRKDDPA